MILRQSTAALRVLKNNYGITKKRLIFKTGEINRLGTGGKGGREEGICVAMLEVKGHIAPTRNSTSSAYFSQVRKNHEKSPHYEDIM